MMAQEAQQPTNAYALILNAIATDTVDELTPLGVPPFVRTLAMPGIDGWEKGRVWGQWNVTRDVFHHTQAVFGGYLSALADSAGSLAMMTVLDQNQDFRTLELNFSFFRPVRSGVLAFEGKVTHQSRNTAYVDVAFTLSRDRLAGRARLIQLVMPPNSAR